MLACDFFTVDTVLLAWALRNSSHVGPVLFGEGSKVGVAPSIGTVGDSFDNAMAESVTSSIRSV